MNGKELKVIENGLDFGVKSRMVNVFGCFRYKANNGLYVIYADVDTGYNVIYYGSSHVKGNSLLSMSCPKESGEIIKEYIFKVTSGEKLDNFEITSLDSIESIELISSNHMEIKKEVLTSLIDKTIPKPAIEEPEKAPSKKKKKKSHIGLLLFLIVAIAALGGAYLTLDSSTSEVSTKYITCTITYQHKTLNATTDEEVIYYFDHQDVLETINTTTTYQFNSESDYEDFISKGTYYKYMPDSDTEGGWDIDDTTLTFKVITKDRIDETTYTDSTNYEDVLVTAKDKGYTCEENIG